MSRRAYFPFFKALAISAAVVLTPFVGVEFILHNHAESRGREELQSVAGLYVQRAEAALSEAVSSLRRLHQNGEADCRATSRRDFVSEVDRSEFIRTIGLVDSNGLAMCMEPKSPLATATLLPPYQRDAPTIAIGIIEDANGVRSAIAGWHIGNGDRIIARLSQESLAINAGPEYLRADMVADVRLSDGSLWYRTGSFDNRADTGDILVETIRSSNFPLRATVSVPRHAALSLVRQLDIIATITAISAVLVLTIVLMRLHVTDKRSGLIDQIDDALKQREFIPFFQPVMDIDSGRLVGCEALVRWQKEDGRMIMPGDFIQTAEATGQIFPITLQLMEQVNAQLGELYAAHPEFKVSINLAAGHLDDRDIVDDIKRIFGKGPMDFSQLVFEVTERQELKDVDGARRILAEIRSLGARTALDDVGTGHSGLAYLQKLGVDIVKIDKMFIDQLTTDKNSHAIVDKLVELAESLDMGIIAEGVENFEQVEILRELGVSSAQGFLFAPPLPLNVFVQLAKSLSVTSAASRVAAGDEAEGDPGEEVDDSAVA